MFMRADDFGDGGAEDEFSDVGERPSTASSTSAAANMNSPAARAEKLRQRQLLEQQKRKQRGAAMPMVMRAQEDIPRPSTPSTNRQRAFSTPSASPVASPYPVASPSSSHSRSDSMADDGLETRKNLFAEPMVGIMDDSSQEEGKQLTNAERDMLIYDPTRATADTVQLDFSDMRSFLMNPAPRGALVKCHIIRRQDSLSFYPVYELYTHDERFLLAAQKKTKNTTSNYVISMDKDDINKGANCLGKLRANFVGTEFVSYDKGLNPNEVDPAAASVSLLTVRQEMAVVVYQSNILVSRGPRKMLVGIPSVRQDGTRNVFRPMQSSESMLTKIKEEKNENIVVLQNKPPKWNDHVSAYVLNFNGRVTQASVKNFQLIQNENPEYVVLQFGKVASHKFTMDYQWPMSAFQAFSICLSSFDYKIACE
eukprot:TRINITY_DN2657_c0_g1_i2.p1 TRINITY_DN2657_c0_g1~~TRINITY_DN2657_c0_g1_i2.p1  ORF type:complete len:424 (+),score=85.29 TRINITY_DN2657_c0_g1_i2:106-1377(+)